MLGKATGSQKISGSNRIYIFDYEVNILKAFGVKPKKMESQV